MTNRVPGDEFRRVMRRVPGAVFLLTATTRKGERVGMTVTAVTSLLDNPSSLIVCVNQSAGCHDALIDADLFGVGLVGSNDIDLARRFACVPQRERFADGEWRTPTDGPPLCERAVLSLICRRSAALPAFTHSILIGEVIEIVPGAGHALLAHDGGFATCAETRLGVS